MLRTIFRMLKGKQRTKTCLNKDSSSNVIQPASNMHLVLSGLETIPGAVLLALSGPGGCVPYSRSVGVT